MWNNIDAILPKVSKPGRYTGGEWNSVVKDWKTVDLKVALAFPDVYEVGMSNLGLTILYDLLNSRENVAAERVFAPWPDLEEIMRISGIPLFSLESKTPIAEFDLIGFSLGYELNYTNVLNMLDLANIPIRAIERGQDQPLIIAGGSCTLNAEPMADFIDLFVLGDGEDSLDRIADLFLEERERTGGGRPDKEEFLRKAMRITGVYVPRFYDIAYHGDGTIARIIPCRPEVPSPVVRSIIPDMRPSVTRPILPYLETIHDRAAVEIQRGCTRACRFCQAGIIYRPLRERPKQEVLDSVEAILKNTGHQELSLVSLSSSDYSDIAGLVSDLVSCYREPRLNVSLPSLRIDSFSVELAEQIQRGKKTSFTFAPEAGTQRLRDVINKGVTEEDLLRSAETAFSMGWQAVKLYFMIGLPTETDEDVEGIVDLVQKVRIVGRKHAGSKASVRVSVATFVPKSHTPFQWSAQIDEASLANRQEILKRGLRGGGVTLSWHDLKVSQLEAMLARGDRRLGMAIEAAWKLGCKFDAWSEYFHFDKWRQALSESGLDLSFYAHRERPLAEITPWHHLSSGVSQAYLRWEYRKATEASSTADCRTDRCSSCGLQKIIPECRQHQERDLDALRSRKADSATT
ncbi:MAG: TIGR03960 family B12-binding radical SAM protein [Dehalococcoidia bacterium]|nr:TIGR03960 family B12-binding radical SAM protein [Dehalococcoidia bacterium]